MTTGSDETVLFQAKPSLRRAYAIGFVYALLVCVGRFRTDLDPRLNPVWWGFFGILVVLLALAHLRSWCTSYVITATEVRVAAGVLSRRIDVVPYRRITNAAARQAPLERILGLANLEINTAGSSAAEACFQRITLEDARTAGAIIRRKLEADHVATERAATERAG